MRHAAILVACIQVCKLIAPAMIHIVRPQWCQGLIELPIEAHLVRVGGKLGVADHRLQCLVLACWDEETPNDGTQTPI